MAEHRDVPDDIVARMRAICLRLPEAVQEDAWAGTRWSVRRQNFAHVVAIDDGWPPAYAKAAGTAGPAVVLTFRSSGDELDALTLAGPPFFRPPWAPNIVGMLLGPDADWDEITELVTESYCVMAPKKLADQIGRPAP
jgi:hypothetical protein